MKRTGLALRTGMNYNSCMRYLKLLKTMGWIEQRNGEGLERTLLITPVGKEIESRLSCFLNISDIADRDAESMLEFSEEIMTASYDDGPHRNDQDVPSDSMEVRTSSAKQGRRKAEHASLSIPRTVRPSNFMKKNARRIMLVDDEQDILVTYKSILTHAGYDVDPFSQPELALNRFAAAPPSYYDLLIMDIRMPRINGIQLYQRIKAISPSTKILFVSSLDAARELASILPDMKDTSILKKPLDKIQLIQKVKETV